MKNNIWTKSAIAIAAVCLFYFLAGLMFPVLMAMAVSFVLYPLVKKIAKVRINGRRIPNTLAIVLTFVLVGLVIYAMITFMIKPLILQINDILMHIPYSANAGAGAWESLFSSERMQELPPNVRNLVSQLIQNVLDSVMVIAKSLMQTTFGVAAGMLSLFIVPFLAFYFLKDWRALRKMAVSLFAPASRPLVYRITQELGTTLCEYAGGMLKMCLIAGICITGITSLVNSSYALVMGTQAAILELIPVIGPLLCTLIAVFFAYTSGSSLVLPMIIGYGCYYILDSQVLLPQVMKRSLDIHPVVIIMGVIIGGKIFGIMGLVFVVPVLCVAKVLYKHLWHLDEELSLKDN